MTRVWIVGIFFAVAGPLGQPALPPLVQIHAVVSSMSGTPVPLLTRDDFEVRADDVERPVETFIARHRPTVAVLFDVSASVFTVPGSLEEAATCLADGVDARDRVRIGAVARHLFLGPIRSDRESIRKDLVTVFNPKADDIVGPSPLWDAISVVAAQLRNVPGPRVILLVTDGRATGNRLSLSQAAGDAIYGNVAVNVVFVGPPAHASIIPQEASNAVLIRPFAPLESLTLYTGGALVHASPASPAESLSALFLQLRDTYTLGFRPAVADGNMHRLKVRVKREGLKVNAPAGYHPGSGTSTDQKNSTNRLPPPGG